MDANLPQIHVAHHWVKEEGRNAATLFPYRFHPVHPCLEKVWGGRNGDELGCFRGNDDEWDVFWGVWIYALH